MCSGGRLLADFVAGGRERPEVPAELEHSLTTTVDDRWVVWAHKVGHPHGDRFRPLTGYGSYPVDAVAECRLMRGHAAPEPRCTCGFHAVSEGSRLPFGGTRWDVALSGRVLAFEWGRGVLFRAERQTVVRVGTSAPDSEEWFVRPPEDPEGRLLRLRARPPRGVGPVRLQLPTMTPPTVAIDDDAGFCVAASAEVVRRAQLVGT